MPVRLGMGITQYNDPVTEPMADIAREAADEQDAEIISEVEVPGVSEAPLAADRLARLDGVDAVAVIGAIVNGATGHDEVVGNVAGDKLTQVTLDRDTPVTFGVSCPGLSGAEARERTEKGAGAVNAAVELVESLP